MTTSTGTPDRIDGTPDDSDVTSPPTGRLTSRAPHVTHEATALFIDELQSMLVSYDALLDDPTIDHDVATATIELIEDLIDMLSDELDALATPEHVAAGSVRCAGAPTMVEPSVDLPTTFEVDVPRSTVPRPTDV